MAAHRSSRAISIRDVTPRDGLQSETPVPPAARASLAGALARAGLGDVEVASFVSPRKVPAMEGAVEVVASLPSSPDTSWWALAPNARGVRDAAAVGLANLTVTISASDGYSWKNTGRSVDEAIAVLRDVSAAASGAALDVVVSCAFGSPFDDVTDPGRVAEMISSVESAVGPRWITLADTTGTATPRRIGAVLRLLPDDVRARVGLHLHDTRGTALTNALWAIEHGVRRIDASTGGLGGSPFAPGSGGNLATEELVLVLEDLGVDTGVDIDDLFRIAERLSSLIGRPVRSPVSFAGRLNRFG